LKRWSVAHEMRNELLLKSINPIAITNSGDTPGI